MSAKLGLRKLKEQKSSKKINHPLAKYNSLGQLSCAVCSLQLKSDLLWMPHLQSKRHKENVAELKAKGTKSENSSSSREAKRNFNQITSMEGDVEKNSKGSEKYRKLERTGGERTRKVAATVKTQEEKVSSQLPADFFDSSPSTSQPLKTQVPNGSKTKSSNDPKSTEDSEDLKETKESASTSDNKISELLPEGFFDDAKQDAKVRKVEYIDKKEEEWEEFQKMIAAETKVSEILQAEEEEESKVEKDLTEYTELRQYLTRVSKLKDRRQKMAESTKKSKSLDGDINPDSSSDSDEEIEDILNWRAKKA